MNKNATRGIIILAILLVVFSVIAFVIPFPKNTVFWIAYLCGVFAILFQCASGKFDDPMHWFLYGIILVDCLRKKALIEDKQYP